MNNKTAAIPQSRPDARKSRLPGVELLRIVTMLMILTSHFFVHGGILGKLSPDSPYFFICWIIEAFCYVMVNCYALITGYFQSSSKFKLKKLLLLWGQIIFISAFSYIILAAFGKIEFRWSDFSRAALPVVMQRYWFATAYVILYAISPLLNFVIERMNKREFTICIAVLCGIFVVFRNFFYWSDFANLHGGYSWVSLAVLYMVGAYMRIHRPVIKHPLILYSVLSLITALSRIILTIFWYRFEFDSVYLKALMQYNSVTVVAASVCLFYFFLNLEIKNRAALALIELFSPATFGVYLIHEQIEVKSILWKFIKPARYLGTPYLILYLIGVVLSLFIACALTDRLRGILSGILHIPQLFERAANKIAMAARALLKDV